MKAVTDVMKVLTLFWIHLMIGATICYFGSGDASQTTPCNANEDRTVRLATGTNSSEGIVEVCVNGTRGHVCSASWDIADANVVCSSLGFTRAIRSFTEVPTEFINDEIVLYDVDCRGDESSLFDCPHDVNLTGNCHVGGAAGIECLNDLEYVTCVPGLCHEDLEMKDSFCEPLTEGCFILPWNDQLNCFNNDLGLFSLQCLSWEELGSLYSSEGIKGEERVELIDFSHGAGLLLIERGFFRGFENLLFLYLDGNNITEIQRGTFEELSSLRILNLSSNSIHHLFHGVFDGLESLRMLDLSYNPLVHIDEKSFANLWNLEYLFLVDIYLPSIEADVAQNLSSLSAVSASDSRICCIVAHTENVNCTRTSPQNPLDTCGRLYPSLLLRIFGWIIGLTALVGNLMVIAQRFRQEKKMNVQALLIINLAVADCLMGVYMIFITSADVHFGAAFFLSAPWWRNSNICKVAGVLAFLSSELSVLILTLITLDRIICIVFPFGKNRLSLKVTGVLLVLMWVVVFVVALVPFVLDPDLSGVYGLSDVCLGLPLHVDSGETGILRFLRESEAAEEFVVVYETVSSDIRPSWIYSVVIFIAINMVLFILMLVCYTLMFIQVKKSSQSIGNTEMRGRDIKVARKMAFIVGTDFVCWMPIIIMGILTQTGLVVLPSSLYAWIVIFILPINSSINPILYTFMNTKEKKRKPKKGTSNVQANPKNTNNLGASEISYSSDYSTKDTTV